MVATVRHTFVSDKDDPLDPTRIGKTKWNGVHEMEDVASQTDLDDVGAALASKAPTSSIGLPAALTGAVTATRYVGGTASVAPTTGTFAVGDFVISADGKIYICTTAGTPGTWELIRGKPLALTGATAATRYVGATASGAPASGTFAVGDFVVTADGHLFVCTGAGTPGTWVNVGAASGDLAGLIAFSGSIEPPQITADVNNYNPTGVATASVIRVFSDAIRFMSGLAATATNGRIVTLQNTGSFDIILRQDSGSSAAGNRFKIPAPMNIKPNEGVVLQYDTTASRWRVVGGVPDSPPSTILDNFYVSTNGSDQNDGRSWKSSMLTPAAAIAAAAGTGDIWFGPGLFTWADTLTIAQGVRLHGKSPHAAASGGTEFKWSGPDDGRPGLITAASAATDWSQGIIENIRFNGLSTPMTGGGNCLNIRNAQNGAKLFNVRVVGWSTGIGINVYTVLNTGYPGYASFENVWVTGGKVAGWNIECPMTDLLFLHCGSDPVGAQATAHAWILSSPGYPTGAAVNKTITSSSQSGAVATHIITGHGASVGWQVDISGSNVDGYNGVHYVSSVVDANTITVNMGALTGLGAGTGGTMHRVAGGDYGTATFIACKSESGVADAGWLFRSATGIAMIGCSYLEQTDNAGGIAFEYRGPLRNIEGDVLVAPRLSMTECISQNMEYQFVASKFGISIKPNNGYGGGRRQHITYTGHMNTPVTDLVAMPVPANPLSGTRRMFTDSATGEVSVRTSAGATVSLEGSAGSPAASAVTVNSATLVGVGTNVQAVLEELDDAVAAVGSGTLPWINVQDAPYSATGDGTTDDSAAFQAAIDSVTTGTGVPSRAILVPPGTYNLNSLSVNRKAIRFIGAGIGNPTNYTANPGHGTTLQYNGAAAGYMFNVQDSEWLSWENMLILGNKTNVPNDLIYFQSAGGSVGTNSQLFLDRVNFGKFPWSTPSTTTGDTAVNAVRFGGTNANNDQFHFTDVFFAYVQNGLVLDNSQSIWGELDNVEFDHCTVAGLTTAASIQGTNLTFNSCALDFLINSTAKVYVHGYWSEGSGQYVRLTAGGGLFSAFGGLITATAALTTNMFDHQACQTGGGIALRDIYLNMASETGRKIKARSTAGPPTGGLIDIANVGRYITLANLDIVTSTGAVTLDVRFISNGYGVFRQLAASQTFDVADTAAFPASRIGIADAGSDFTATTVEGALDELQADSEAHLADTSTAHTAASVDAVATGGGGTETVKAVGNTGSTETIALALSDGNVQTFTVNADCVFTMPSGLGAGAKSFTAILTDSGGPRTITFTGVKWSGGANPTVMSGASAVDIFTFLTIDGGTTWYGFIGGQAMAV